MRVITVVCSMSAINWSRPPHRRHARTSNANVRRIRSAQRSRRTRLRAVGEAAPRATRVRRLRWADLMRRTFAFDVTRAYGAAADSS